MKRIGDIVDLPRSPLTARFGGELMRQLDRALGREHEPLDPRLPVATYVAEQRFAEPIAREEDVLGTIARLAARLAVRVGAARRRRAAASSSRCSAPTAKCAASPPAARARCAIPNRSARCSSSGWPRSPTNSIPASASTWRGYRCWSPSPAPPEQIGISGGEDTAEVDRLVDRLSARLGSRRVRRLIAQDSHIPEIAAVAMPAQTARAAAGWPAFRQFRAQADLAPRPLRLLTRPEPIEAVAEVPDGPPLRFRWRRALHEVIAAEGPERIEGAWWSEHGGAARDYFRVEDKAGLRFWLFRAGLYRDLSHGAAAPTWFLHGTFA